jgi:hypothetical protein
MSNHHERVTGEDEEVKPPSERSFGITFGIVFLIIGLLPLIHGGAIRLWALAVSAAFLLVAFLFAPLLRPLNLIWLRFGLLLHRVVNPVVLGAMFFLAVTPMAAFIRLRGQRLLQRQFEPDRQSYWTRREPPGPEPDSMRHQF